MDPFEHHTQRLALRETRLAELQRVHERLGALRLWLAAGFLILAWSCAERGVPAAWLFVPVGLFAAVLVHHHRVRMQRAQARRSVDFHRAALERLQGRWSSRPTGAAFLDPHHLYGADLDLFGEGSLFQQLCAARTPMGEAELAGWLLAAAPRDVLLERRRRIAELRDRTELREDLATLGELQRIALQPQALERWLAAPDELAASWVTLAAAGLPALAAITAAAWGWWGIAHPFFGVLVIEAGLNHLLRPRMQRCVAGIENAYEDLKLLAGLLGRIERERFDAPALRSLQERLASPAPPAAGAAPGQPVSGQPASVTLARLATLVNFIEARRNPFLAPLMLPSLYTLHAALAAERWRRRHGRRVAQWLRVLGETEALLSIAGYAFEHPYHPFPELLDGPATFDASALGHPLIAPATRVCNDVVIAGPTRILLVSGSNMSGKSTLLRAVGLNTVLAMAGAPVCAGRLRLTPLRVGASIRVNDSLHEGSSRFYAEITRLRRLFEPSELPLLFLLDELLQGTNSHDRLVGAQGVVRALLARGAIGLISTHDLALTGDAGLEPGALRNVHFQDRLENGRLTFDFRLREGVVTRSNGVELMRAIGLEV